MPEVVRGWHLIEMLMECGPCMYSGNGPTPLTFSEIDAWSRITRIEIEGHEAETIREMSEVYCAAWRASRNPNCPDPCGGTENLAEAFGNLLMRFSA